MTPTASQVRRRAARSRHIFVRRAGPGDVHGIAELWERAGLPSSSRGFRKEIARLRRRDPELVLIAMLDGKLAGAIAGSYDGRTAMVSRLAVDAAARRRGVGLRLVEALCDQLNSLGAGADKLIVLDDSATADAFWTSLGFRRGDTAVYFVRGRP